MTDWRTPSSASAIARAPLVRCSISEDDADSVRRRMEATGRPPGPVSASNRVSNCVASSAAAASSPDMSTTSFAICGTMAADYGRSPIWLLGLLSENSCASYFHLKA